MASRLRWFLLDICMALDESGYSSALEQCLEKNCLHERRSRLAVG